MFSELFDSSVESLLGVVWFVPCCCCCDFTIDLDTIESVCWHCNPADYWDSDRLKVLVGTEPPWVSVHWSTECWLIVCVIIMTLCPVWRVIKLLVVIVVTLCWIRSCSVYDFSQMWHDCVPVWQWLCSIHCFDCFSFTVHSLRRTFSDCVPSVDEPVESTETSEHPSNTVSSYFFQLYYKLHCYMTNSAEFTLFRKQCILAFKMNFTYCVYVPFFFSSSLQ